jgi:peptide/nickel transport system permease protein
LTDVLNPNLKPTALTPTPEQVSPISQTDAAQGLTVASMSPRRMAFRRFLRHRAALVCTILMLLMILFVLIPSSLSSLGEPLSARYGVNDQVFRAEPGKPNSFLEPGDVAWLGTDDIGRDLYSRLIYGLRVSLTIGFAAAICSVVVGATLGAIAGLKGGWFDDALMRVTDVFLAFPFLVALLVMRNVLGAAERSSWTKWIHWITGDLSSTRFVVVLFVIFGWMGVARLVRGQVLSLKEREFVEASRALGASNTRIIIRHLLPNSVGPLLVALTTAVVGAIIGEATLSFFGYGPDPASGNTSLGILVANGKENLLTNSWWLPLFPCVLLVLVTLCVNFIGDGLRDATDPKLQERG